MAKDYLFPGGVLSLPRKAALRLLEGGSGDAALLYLCLLAGQAPTSLGWAAPRLIQARESLLSLHLIDPDAPVPDAPPPKLEPDTPPDYGRGDITLALGSNPGFAGLVPEIERLLGKPLSSADLKTLYLLFDFLALPPEVILTLVAWCVGQTAQKYGPGRKPTLSQIKKEGFRWQRAGVDTLEVADAYVRRLTQLDDRVVQLMELVELRGRAPVGDERKYLQSWAEMGFQDDAIRLAYEKTVLHTGKLTWSYLNKILRSWQQKGLYSAAAVEEGEGKRKSPAHPHPSTRAPAPGDDSLRPSDDLEGLFHQTPPSEEDSHHGI